MSVQCLLLDEDEAKIALQEYVNRRLVGTVTVGYLRYPTTKDRMLGVWFSRHKEEAASDS